MNLILKIIDSHNFDPNGNNIKEFHQKGGSIGRQSSNDFVLIDHEKSVSKLHAFIHYRDNQYYLTDVSTNGVFFNEEDTAVSDSVDNPRIIQEGDNIRIGYYLLQASLEEDAAAIVQEIEAEKQNNSDIAADIEALLASTSDHALLPRQRVKVHNNFTGQFGGSELHNNLGIEQSTREAKHVAGDLNIDDFLNQNVDINLIPNDDPSDLLDLDNFDDDDTLMKDIEPLTQRNQPDNAQRLADLAIQLATANDSERDVILEEIKRLSSDR